MGSVMCCTKHLQISKLGMHNSGDFRPGLCTESGSWSLPSILCGVTPRDSPFLIPQMLDFLELEAWHVSAPNDPFLGYLLVESIKLCDNSPLGCFNLES